MQNTEKSSLWVDLPHEDQATFLLVHNLPHKERILHRRRLTLNDRLALNAIGRAYAQHQQEKEEALLAQEKAQQEKKDAEYSALQAQIAEAQRKTISHWDHLPKPAKDLYENFLSLSPLDKIRYRAALPSAEQNNLAVMRNYHRARHIPAITPWETLPEDQQTNYLTMRALPAQKRAAFRRTLTPDQLINLNRAGRFFGQHKKCEAERIKEAQKTDNQLHDLLEDHPQHIIDQALEIATALIDYCEENLISATLTQKITSTARSQKRASEKLALLRALPKEKPPTKKSLKEKQKASTRKILKDLADKRKQKAIQKRSHWQLCQMCQRTRPPRFYKDKQDQHCADCHYCLDNNHDEVHKGRCR